MQKFLYAVIAAMLLTPRVNAQIFTFGPKAGFNFTQLNVNESSLPEGLTIMDIPNERKVGVLVGAFMQLNLGPFVLQPEMVFSHHTGQLEFRDIGISDIKKVQFNQVDIPILAGLNISRFLRVQAGPVMTYVMDVGASPGIGNVLDAFVNDFDQKTWGYQAGAGLDLGRLALDVRYGGNFGKRSISFDVDGTSHSIDVGRNAIQVTAGINIIK